MKFLSDILTESKEDNKYSSKKSMGLLVGVLVCIAFIGDGFNWFTVNTELFNSIILLIGLVNILINKKKKYS